MISIAEVIHILKQNLQILPGEEINVSQSLGRFVECDIVSPIDVPSFDNSAMDGYALFFVENSSEYNLVAGNSIAAGDFSQLKLQPGEAIRIFTGAPIPEGADTVVQQELSSVQNGKLLVETNLIQKGNHIRPKGAQCLSGQIIVKAGTHITPGVIALLCSVGITKVKVFSQPKISLIITGNELVEPGNILNKGKIYNSNESTVLAFISSLGIQSVDSIRVKDDYETLYQQIRNKLARVDVLILTGGISVGEYDFVYQALKENEVETLVYKVKQKPGKPFYIGKKENKIIFALPGNPAAVISCFNQYVKPALKMMMGDNKAFSPSCLLPLAHHWIKKTNLSNILKAKVENNEVFILNGQDSFNLKPFGEANALVVIYESDMSKNKGDLVEVYYLN
ncbi:MAG: molybdopterin molybdotransferase MoeA [Bacteroidetes bacterium]|nr:molybdopterin molybdotransferase MoeA [Bacteroidota bacterium]